jgi:hypothetical protein
MEFTRYENPMISNDINDMSKEQLTNDYPFESFRPSIIFSGIILKLSLRLKVKKKLLSRFTGLNIDSF